MSRFTDAGYLRDEQYRDDANLRARMDLHRRFSTNPEPWHRWVFDRLDLADDARILEVGCGPAALWRENADRIPAGWRLTLADLSPGMVEAARRALATAPHELEGGGVGFVVADVQELPFEDESFDGAIANHMLYHVPDRPRALTELARVLRPGGRLFAATNGAGHLHEIRTLAPERQPWSVEFTLENGGEQIARRFEAVEVERFPGSLEVTEAQSLLAYLRSCEAASGRVEEEIRGEIERRGSFHVTTSAGLFRARKP